MTLKVVHFGTGNTGMFGVRQILDHPELELVGHYVMSPEKIGVDSGTLVGRDPCGIIATNNLEELLALDADCFCHMGDSIGKGTEPVELCARFLERGTNVASLSIFPWAHPASCAPELRDPAEAACEKGQSTAFFTGIDPGWATTDLAIAALAGAGRIDCVRVCELGYWRGYDAEYVCREYWGFGQPPGFKPQLIAGGVLQDMWAPTIYEIADKLDVEIEEFNIVHEVDTVDYDVETAFGLVKAGTAVALHFELQGMSGGRPMVIVEHNDLCVRDAGKQWKLPYNDTDLAYRIEIEGDPDYQLELSFDAPQGLAVTAMTVVNSIPKVCAASPGLKGPYELPRYWSRVVDGRKMMTQA
ncbi:MAG: dihydrodipicolinate reductase [Pseudomonadota bacterium]